MPLIEGLDSSNAVQQAKVNSDGAVYTADGGHALATSFGVSSAAVTSADASSGVDVTDAPTTGEKIVIVDVVFSSDTAMQLDFVEETSGTVIFTFHLAANQSFQFTPRTKIKLATANKKLRANASVAGNIAVTVGYYSEA